MRVNIIEKVVLFSTLSFTGVINWCDVIEVKINTSALLIQCTHRHPKSGKVRE